MKKRIICLFTVLTLIFCAAPLNAGAVGDVIDFTRDSIDLYLDQSYQLTMKGSPVVSSYYSSDPDIASVSSTGMVNARSAGSSIVTAYDDKGNSATCTVNVHDGASPQKVVPETQSLSMTEGETYALKASVEPADVHDTRLYYSSSDESVARIDKNGYIKALKAGVAVITIESASAAVSTGCIVKVASKSGRNFSVSVNGSLYSMAGEKKANMLMVISKANESYECTTDVDGKFYFDDIVQGSYTLSVYKNAQEHTPAATGQLAVGSYEMNISCIINDQQLVILYQNETKGTEAVRDVTLDKNTVNLEEGASYDMSFKVRPSNAALPAMKGVSDNEKVATVDIDGRITALSEGTANVTFSTPDGKISRTCKVSVTAATRNTYSWIIIILETLILILIVVSFLISYHRFNRNKEKEEGIEHFKAAPKKRSRIK